MLIDKIVTAKESHGEIGRTLSTAEQKVVLDGYIDSDREVAQPILVVSTLLTLIQLITAIVDMFLFWDILQKLPIVSTIQNLGYYELEPRRIPPCSIL